MTVLTLADIQSSETLQSLGALAGDKVEDGGLVRVFSEDEDELGQKITAQDISQSETLQKLGAKDGDRVVNGELIQTEQDSAWRAFRYGKAKGEEEGIVDYATNILTQHFPTVGNMVDYGLNRIAHHLLPGDLTDTWADKLRSHNRKYQSADERYGEGFTQATPDQRREMMLRAKERALQKQFKGYVPQGGFAQGTGEIWGTLKDPTTLLPAGQGIKAMVGIGAAMGGTYSAAQDLATKGKVDPTKAGLFAAGGAVLPVGIVGGFKAIPIVKKGVAGLYTKGTSQKTVRKAQALIAKKQSQGITVTEKSLPEIAQEIGVSPSRLVDSYKAQKVEPRFHSSVDEAEKALQASIAEDSSMLRTVSKQADNFLGALSTRIKNIDDGLYGRLMKAEFDLHKNTQGYLSRTEPFMRQMDTLPKEAQQELNFYLRSGNFDAAESWMRAKAPQLLETTTGPTRMVIRPFDDVKQVLTDLGEELAANGHKVDVENYFPSSVKSYEGILKGLGVKQRNIFTKELEKVAASKKKTVGQLTDTERDRAIEKVIKGKNFDKSDVGPRNTKQRMLGPEDLSVELMKHYESPVHALQSYIRSSVNHVERKKFFGKTVVDDLDDASGMDVNASISTLVEEMNARGNLTTDQALELQKVLGARWSSDGKQMHGALIGIKNLGYIGTLGDFMSTLTQIADTTNIMGYHGFGNTIKAAFKAKDFKLDDIGMADSIARELGDSGKFSKTLNSVLKVTGFKKIDRFGKETLMNAVKKKYSKQLNTQKGVDKFKEKWGDIYGPEIDTIIGQLQRGEKTELTNLHMFTKLSEHQPISYSEYPAAYMNNPNGRIFYMLKSFTLKQYDLVRRNLYQEFKKAGSKRAKAKVMAKAGKVAAFMSAGGLGVDKTKDWILGRDIKPEDLGWDAVYALAGAFGVNKYAGDKFLKQGDLAGFADNLTDIPLPVFQGIQSLMTGDFTKTAKSVPIIGRTLHSRAFGGAKKYNKKLRKSR